MLYEKYRPKSFDNIIGQSVSINILKNIALNYEKFIIHGIIISGPFGCGKTLCASIFARMLNCNQLCGICESCLNINDITSDIIVIDGALNSGIDHIRQLIERVKYAPFRLKYRVIIIEEAHMLSKESMDVLLLTLQNPTPNTIFVFTTTDINKMTNTLKSRCLLILINKIDNNDIINELSRICTLENINLFYDILTIIANKSQGSLRQALSYLETIYLANIKTEKEVMLYLNILSIDSISDIFIALLYGNIKQAWNLWLSLSTIYSEKILLQTFEQLFTNIILCKEGYSHILPLSINNDIILNSISNSLLLQFIDILHHCIFMLNIDCQNIILTFFYMITHIDNNINIKNYIKNYDKIQEKVSLIINNNTLINSIN